MKDFLIPWAIISMAIFLSIQGYSYFYPCQKCSDPSISTRQSYATRLLICREEFTHKIKIHGPEQEETAKQLEDSCRKIAKGGGE